MKRLLTLWLFLMLLLPAIALVACGGGEEGTPTATPAVTATAQATSTATVTPITAATPTPIPSPPPIPQAMLFGQVNIEEPGVVVSGSGEELRVSLSDNGDLWHFKPDDRWEVSGADGTVLFSGTIVEEVPLWGQVAGFVRLDDGSLVAYTLDTAKNWAVYPAEGICALAGYFAEQDLAAEVVQSFLNVVAICRDKLGITEGIPETP
jgi:hypothetical protein